MDESPLAEPLLTCLRHPEGQHKLTRLQALAAAEWQAALDQARLYGVTPLLYWQVKDIGGQSDLPPDRLSDLRTSFLNSAARNLLLYHDLAAILAALEAQGIQAILLKGAHLAKFVYPEAALRPMTDIDLLLRPDNLPRAARILEGLGYATSRDFDLERELRKHQHIPALIQPGKAPLELHWQIATPASRLRVDLDGLWERAQPVDLGSLQALVLSPEDLLLHLCFHLLQDEFAGGLRRLNDIVALLSYYGPRLDWAQAQARSAAWGCQKSLFLVLYLAHTLLNAPVPAGVLDELRPVDFNPQIEALARQRALSLRPQHPELHPDLARLRRRRSLPEKTGALLGALFPYPEYVAAKYSLPPGSRKVYFYYLVRLKDLARRYGWQLWRVLSSDESAAALAHNENALNDWCMVE